MILSLIGYRTSGKTTVGRLLAERLERPFIDCDDYIEQRTGLSIAEIFQKCGESYFRDLESQALDSLTRRDGIVLATGGGAVLRYKNTQLLQRSGKVVYLNISAEEAFRRTVKDPNSAPTRPPLTDLDLLSEIREHLRVRSPHYAAAASFCVNVDGIDVDAVARQIHHFLAES
jgi:shikimate kinase